MTFTFLCTSVLTLYSLYYAYIDIEGKTSKNRVNYVIRICQHVLDNINYFGVAINIPPDKIPTLSKAKTLPSMTMRIFYLNPFMYVRVV